MNITEYAFMGLSFCADNRSHKPNWSAIIPTQYPNIDDKKWSHSCRIVEAETTARKFGAMG